MIKKHIKKGLAFVLTLATLLSLFSGITSVYAMDLSQSYEVSWDHTLTDEDGKTFTWYGGINASSNEFGHSYGNVAHTIHDYTVKRNGLTGNNTDWEYDKDYVYAYCIEPGVPLPNKTEYMGSDSATNGDKWERMSSQQRDLIMLALSYGYPNRMVSTSKDANALYAATQLVVWQIALGWRTSPTALNDQSYPMSGHSGTMTEQLTSSKYLKAFYDAILSDMAKHGTRPSFTGTAASIPTYELTESGGQYVLTLTDTNNVLSDFYVSSAGGLSASISGNTLTIRSSTPITNEAQISLERRMPTTGYTTGFLTWSVPGKEGANQDMVTGVSNDPLRGYLKLKVSVGNLAIMKTTKNNGGSVSGFTFEVRNSGGGLVGTYTTNSTGKIDIPNLQPGVYSVREINLSSDFVTPAQNPNSVTVASGQTASVSFDNIKKIEIITVRKTNANPTMGGYSLAGAVFEVRDQNGTLVDTITTDGTGRAQTKALPLGAYRVKETKAPYGFVIDKSTYNSTLSGTLGTDEIVYAPDVSIAEQPQIGTITITKLDKATGTRAQGDSTLNGVVFEVYSAADIKGQDGSLIYGKDQLVETLYCGNSSSATTKELPLGDYYYKEKVPPVGYTLDPNSYPVTIEYQGQEVSVVKKYGDLKNKVIEGQIAIVKHTDNPDPDVSPSNPQVEEPLEGAKFEVFLKSAGSYNNALPTERDILITDSDGYAKTKTLPYGIYTVKETYAPGDLKLVEPFDVFISKDGNVYRYILSDPLFRSLVKIVKVDSETGKTIPAAAVSFKVKDLSTGKWVVQRINYPSILDIEIYETSPDGTLVMPESLKSGEYELYEQAAPYGYILTKDPVKFSINSNQSDPTIAEVIMANAPAKGIIKVEKVGEMLTCFTTTDTVFGKQYTPVFKLVGLNGATFDVIAAEDIITGDGTLRYAKGTVVDTITTNANGYAETKQLYLGNYTVVETNAPYGFVLDETPHDVSLVYEGQEVPVVSSQIGIGNTRQKAEINLTKICEMPTSADGRLTLQEDFNPYNGIIFGLYAAEDIKAANGRTVIPAGSLMEVITFDKSGKTEIKTDLPFGKFYVQELQTTDGYVLDDTKYDVIFEYAGQDTATVTIDVNGGEPIENKLMRGDLRIIKIFEECETTIPNIPFTIVGKTTVGTTVTIEAVTNENGEIFLENLLVGDYTVTELDSPLSIGYVLSEPQTLTVAADEIAEMTIENKLQRGDLKIIKTFENVSVPIAGVKFTVTGVSVTGIEFNGEFFTDENGEILIEGLPIGEYKVQEIASDLTVGYVLSDEQTAIVADDEVAEMRIENKLIRGNIQILKTDATGKPLAGAKFGLYDLDGNLIAEDISGNDGIAAFLDIPYGEYEIREISAPEGYKKTDEVFKASIKENGETISFEIENELVPPPENPKTGDDSNMAMWIIVMSVSAAALVGLTVAGKRRKKRECK